MPKGEASMITNNRTQIAQGRYKKLWEEKPAFRHSRSYRQEIVIGLEGGPVSLFSAS